MQTATAQDFRVCYNNKYNYNNNNMDNITAIVEYEYKAQELDEIDLHKGDIIHHIKQMEGGWWQGTVDSSGLMGMFPDNFVRVIETATTTSNNLNNSSNNDDTSTVQLRDKTATPNRRCKVIYSYTQVNDDELTLAVGDVIEFLGEVEEGWWRGKLRNKIGVFPSNFVKRIEPSPILARKRPPSTLDTTKGTSATTTTLGSGAGAGLGTAATTTTTKQQTQRLSYHSSKENLLSSNTATAKTTTTSSSSLSSHASSQVANDDTTSAPTLPPKPLREFCRVEFPYAPMNGDELELTVGDIITIITTDLPDKGWWKGELRGKVGVFPDNFVKLLPPAEARRGLLNMERGSSSSSGGSFEFFGSRMANFINTIFAPLNEGQQQPQQSQRTAKPNNTVANATANVVAATANTATHLTTGSASSSSTTSKVIIKKSGSTSSTQSSNRKDSFGSRDSLNDILSETGLQTGNVAAQRKSLENKNLDLTNAADASARLALKKQQHNNSTITTTTTTTSTSANMSNSELRRSLDNLDEKAKSPPPVLTKKPTVPTKKTSSVTSVAGNILSGFKQKVRGVDSKLTTAASHDFADGVGNSKLSPNALPDAAPAGTVIMRRAATIAVEDMEFDRVERSSMLPDMRAGRVKAPKRRPPSAAINVLGESNNNSVYVNGSGMAGSASELSEDGGSGKPQSSDDNSTGEEQLAKPKPREWEKKKAPWMDELKASQVKKKTSPNVEARNSGGGSGGASVADRTSKLFTDETKLINNVATSNLISSAASSSTSSSSLTSSSTTTKVQSSAVTSSSVMQQSMIVENSNKSNSNSNTLTTATSAAVAGTAATSSTNNEIMSKSMSTKISTTSSSGNTNTTITTTTTTTSNNDEETRAARPNSLALRHHLVRSANTSSTLVSSEAVAASTTTTNATSSSSAAAATNNALSNNTKSNALQNNHHGGGGGAADHHPASSTRVIELERRLDKLETVVHKQQRTIDELVRLLREETDRVQILRGELDKYAQCVTQV